MSFWDVTYTYFLGACVLLTLFLFVTTVLKWWRLIELKFAGIMLLWTAGVALYAMQRGDLGGWVALGYSLGAMLLVGAGVAALFVAAAAIAKRSE